MNVDYRKLVVRQWFAYGMVIRNYSPSHIRLIAGTGSLYTVCRVAEDQKYCDAGDRDLLAIAHRLGEHIVWMRNPQGGFFHRLDPFTGTVDRDYYVTYFNGEALMALLELSEMTGDPYWLERAREVNAYMIQQPVTEDHWHGYAFSFLARLDTFTPEDQVYATRIAQAIISDESNLDVEHSAIFHRDQGGGPGGDCPCLPAPGISPGMAGSGDQGARRFRHGPAVAGQRMRVAIVQRYPRLRGRDLPQLRRSIRPCRCPAALDQWGCCLPSGLRG